MTREQYLNQLGEADLIKRLGKNKIEELRTRNEEEIARFDWIDWQQQSPFRTTVINAFMSTMGVSASPEDMGTMVRYAYGEAELDKRTGNTGFTVRYSIWDEEKLGVFNTVVPVESVFDANANFNMASPLVALPVDNQGTVDININNKTSLRVKLRKGPSWMNKQYDSLRGPTTASRLVQWENNVLMLAVPENNRTQLCAYLAKESDACAFCALEQGKYKPLTPNILVDIVKNNLKESEKTSITMTGGNTWGVNRGFGKYVPYVEALRAEFGRDLPIQLEVTPSSNRTFLDWIVENKVSFMGNFEVWSEKASEAIVPAKRRELSKAEYLDIFRYLNKRGVDTYSVLITSLQPFDELFEGVKALAEIGTSAVILPFRPNGGVLVNYTPSRATDLLKSTIGAANIMNRCEVGLDARPKEYCSGCGGCGIDANLRDNNSLLREDKNFQRFEKENKLDELR